MTPLAYIIEKWTCVQKIENNKAHLNECYFYVRESFIRMNVYVFKTSFLDAISMQAPSW